MIKNHEPISAFEAAERAEAMFPVSMQVASIVDISDGSQVVPPSLSKRDDAMARFVVRGDTGKAIACHGAGYQLNPYRWGVLRAAEAFAPNSTVGVDLWPDGRKIIVNQSLPQQEQVDDAIGLASHMMWIDSYDGTWPTMGISFMFNPFCYNQMPMGTRKISVRHLSQHANRLFAGVAELREVLAAQQEASQTIAVLNDIEYQPQRFRYMVDRLTGEKPRTENTRTENRWGETRSNLFEEYSKNCEHQGKASYWCALNAVQSHENHRRPIGWQAKPASIQQQKLRKWEYLAEGNWPMTKKAATVIAEDLRYTFNRKTISGSAIPDSIDNSILSLVA